MVYRSTKAKSSPIFIETSTHEIHKKVSTTNSKEKHQKNKHITSSLPHLESEFLTSPPVFKVTSIPSSALYLLFIS